MATVRKRTYHAGTPKEKQVWVVDYFSTGKDGKLRRHIKTFPLKRDAVTELNKINAELEKGIHTPDRESVTVAAAGELWVAQAEIDKLERSTVRQYRQHLDLHIKPYLAPKKLSALTTKTIQEFRNRLIAEGRSHDMAKRVIVSLGSILGHAMAAGLVARNVVHEQPKQKRRRDQQVGSRQEADLKAGVDFPAIEELRVLLAVQDHRWRPFIITAIFTGLRASELRGLLWDDVDLESGVLHVRQRADRWNAIGATKSKSSRRDIPLVPMAINALREWKLACPKGELDLVFPTGKGTVWSLPNLYRSLAPVQRKAGLAEPYGLHALRHAAASLFIQEGFSPKRVQRLMGHSSIQVTFDVYGHLFPTPDEQVELNRLQARLVG
jgi:integrase